MTAVDLTLLQAELEAASVAVPNGLTALEGTLETVMMYDQGMGVVSLPPEADPVVAAHVAPPLVTAYSGSVEVGRLLRTTDDQPHEIYRFPCDQHRRYRANLLIDGIDAGSFASKVMEGRFVWKRLTANAIMVGSGGGIAVISDLHDTAAASWLPNCLPSGTDVVFTVTGAAGRTIDWKLEGRIDIFAPGGLDAP
jgi:hypothetical protein